MDGSFPHSFDRYSPQAKNNAEINSHIIAGIEISMFICLFIL